MKKIILILGFLLLFPVHSWADPSPGIRWLQKEPVTLFDWGIMRMQYSAEKAVEILREPGVTETHAFVYYDGNKNAFEIDLGVFPDPNTKEWFTPKRCKNTLRKLYEKFGFLYFKSKREFAEQKAMEWFSHKGRMVSLNQPNNLIKNIAESITLKFNIPGVVGHHGGSCSIPFTGGKVSISIPRQYQEDEDFK